MLGISTGKRKAGPERAERLHNGHQGNQRQHQRNHRSHPRRPSGHPRLLGLQRTRHLRRQNRKPLYQDYSYDWRLLPAEEGYDTEDAETIHDIYGEDEDSWETAANKGLEDYGLKLGKFVDTFDFEVAGRRYDGYMLEEI